MSKITIYYGTSTIHGFILLSLQARLCPKPSTTTQQVFPLLIHHMVILVVNELRFLLCEIVARRFTLAALVHYNGGS